MPLSNCDLYRFLERWARDNYPGAVPIEIIVRMSDGGRVRLSVPRYLGDGPISNGGTPSADGWRHSPDFASVRWNGTLYFLTPNQAAVVRQLWDAMEAGTPCVQGATLLEAADCESGKMSDIFKGSHAWLSLVVEGPAKGTYRLAERINGGDMP
jgi:hypothetical protein